MTDQSAESFSLATNAAMDFLGYSDDVIQSRAELYKAFPPVFEKHEKVLKPSRQRKNTELMVTGSKGEGIAKLSESDFDIMFVYRDFLCLDNATKERDICIIKTIATDSPPGYTKLNPVEMDSCVYTKFILEIISEYDLNRGQILLLSTCFRNYSARILEMAYQFIPHDSIVKVGQKHQGPSVPSTYHFNTPITRQVFEKTDLDFVQALPYLSTTMFDSWRKRDRKWPPKFVSQEISETELFAVPVGPCYSENQEFEWRISFTCAERILVSSLSAILRKVYILFKMVNRFVIKPQVDILSSYMIKNVIFWISEQMDPDISNCPEKLIDILLYAFAFLQNCIQCGFLPNYMIHNRNLFLGKGKPKDINQLGCIISTLLQKGGKVIMEVEKIRNSVMYVEKNFAEAKRFSALRDRFEVIILQTQLKALSSVSVDNLFKPSFLYDLTFEMYKEPFFFEFIFLLLKFLNLDVMSLLTDVNKFKEAFKSVF